MMECSDMCEQVNLCSESSEPNEPGEISEQDKEGFRVGMAMQANAEWCV